MAGCDNPVQHKWAIAHLREGRGHTEKISVGLQEPARLGLYPETLSEKRASDKENERSWRQKAYRDRQDSKKPCTLVLSIEAKDMLDQLAELNGISISQTVEKLIRREGTRRLKTGELTRDVTNLTTSQIVEQVSKNFRKIFDTPSQQQEGR